MARALGVALLALAAGGSVDAGAGEATTAAPAPERGGTFLEGGDRARVRLPAELTAAAPAYANHGYRLIRPDGVDGDLMVEVDLGPVESRAACPPPGGAEPKGAAERRAREVAAEAATCYEVVSAVLGWIVHGGEGATDGPATAPRQGDVAAPSAGPGDGLDVALRAVAMLAAAGVEARVVHGLVVGDGAPGSPRGPHHWIEARYPDRGWVFSDPLHHHHYVPARYVRLAAPDTGGAAGAAASLVARRDRRSPVDVYRAGAPGLTARRNDTAQVAAALRVVVSGATEGVAVLTDGGGRRRRQALLGGEGVFVGLDGGRYTLQVLLPGRPAVSRRLDLAPRERSAVFVGDPGREAAGPPAGPAGPSRSRVRGSDPAPR